MTAWPMTEGKAMCLRACKATDEQFEESLREFEGCVKDTVELQVMARECGFADLAEMFQTDLAEIALHVSVIALLTEGKTRERAIALFRKLRKECGCQLTRGE